MNVVRAPGVRLAVSRQMWQVLAALAPGLVLASVFGGLGVLVHTVTALATAVAAEAVLLRLRAQPLEVAVVDGSVLVLALLIALGMPPATTPLITIMGVLVGTVMGKHLYGGLGCNLFNPAMVCYAFLLVCFPVEMSAWAVPVERVDAVSGATLLEYARTQIALGYLVPEFLPRAPRGLFGSTGQEWLVLAWAGGGLYLLAAGVIRWRLPVATLAGFLVAAVIGYALDPSRALGPMLQLCSGSIVLAAFFVVTDPVTTPVTTRAQLLFGLGVGVLTYLMRVQGSFADGVAFAVLMMNASAPWLDGVAQPYSRRIS